MADYQTQLWSFKLDPGRGSLPVMSRTGQVLNAPLDPLNIIEDFEWTVSPKSSRQDVPIIKLTEYRLEANSVFNNLFYAATTLGDQINTAGEQIQAGVNRTEGENNTLRDIVNNTLQTVGQAAQTGSSVGAETVTGILNKSYKQYNGALLPYNNLYAASPTGFEYVFPYLDDVYDVIGNSFGEGQGNVLQAVGEVPRQLATGAAGILGAIEPGTYIEKAKQFQIGDTGRTLSFSIPLLNTKDWTSVTRNWQLIFGLIYQNLPGRLDKTRIDVPVIYEVIAPGIAYMPYAYISNLSVKFLGARRKMVISVPRLNDIAPGALPTTVNIETVIPDAYQIDITVTGLNPETRNMLYESINPNRVTIKSSNTSIGGRIESFVRGLL